MACRRGMGKGKGKGYYNIINKDKKVHSDSARGKKQPQKNVIFNVKKGSPEHLKTEYKKIEDELNKLLYNYENFSDDQRDLAKARIKYLNNLKSVLQKEIALKEYISEGKLNNNFKKQLQNMANNLMRLRETSYKDEEIVDYLDKNIRKIFDKWDNSKIPKWKQNLLFDKVETFIEEDYYSLSDMYKDVENILKE